MSTKAKQQTPLMKQYYAIKTKHKDAILLFRVGDFYETFGEDAVNTSKILGIVLTKRHNGSASEIELAGFPYHSLDSYLPKLVKAGYRVAICDQLEKPSKEKKVVKRGVTELITPGVALNDNILDTAKNNFLASVYFGKEICGVAFIDISTGEFYVAEGSLAYIDKLLQSFQPSEVLYAKKQENEYLEHFAKQYYSYRLESWIYTEDYTTEIIQKQFEINTLKGFGIENSPEIILASGAALQYFSENHLEDVKQLNSISRLTANSHVWMDKFSIKNLELVYSPHPDAKTLSDVIDYTASPMGARLIKKWILMPLVNKHKITERLDIVSFFKDNENIANNIKQELKNIGDIERLISKVPSGKINPREVVQLKKALKAIQPIKDVLLNSKIEALSKYGEQLNPCSTLIEKLENEIEPEAPVNLHKAPTFRAGINDKLDELRNIKNKGKDYLLEIQQRETEKTGISSLKIGFNNVFGYYLEVRHTHKDKVPEDWIRKQTLTAAERYITPELKEYEDKILGAEEKIEVLEADLFAQLVAYLRDYIQAIQMNGHVLAQIDCLINFAYLAEKHNYVRPNINEDLIIDIKDGRHPVIENQLPVEESYVPNDVYLDNESQQIIMITGQYEW
ncbi:MAG: DNA mismatch repair protein MutS [Chitinophagales bacterium]